MSIEAIKKALEGVTHAPGKWEAEGTGVYCDDATGQRVCDTKGEYLFWSEDQKRNAAVYIAAANPVAVSDLLSEIDRLQRENASPLEDRYKLACAITGGEDAPGLLDSVSTSYLVGVAQSTHRLHSADIDRAFAAESEVKRLRLKLKPFSRFAGVLFERNFNRTDSVAGMDDVDGVLHTISAGTFFDAHAALASTGGEHHAE